MGLKDMDIGAALHRLADRKIEQAMREGKFDRIEGAGKPLDLEPAPAEENARLRWWALRILKQNDITPDEVQWRKQIEGLKDELEHATDEPRVRALVAAANALVRRLNTLGTNAMVTSAAVMPVSLDTELAKLRGRWAAMQIAADAAEPPEPAAVAGNPEAEIPTRLEGAAKPPSLLGALFGSAVRTCTTEGCRSRNPGRATYCRRCGGRL